MSSTPDLDTAAPATGPSAPRRSLPLGAAARTFAARPTPWLLLAVLVTGTVGRAAAGSPWTRVDTLVAAAPVVAFPLTEWVIHVVLLHWRPRRLGRWRLDPRVSREHRAHHADPRDLDLVFIPLPTLLWTIAGIGIVTALVARGAAPGWTFVAVEGGLGLTYEWIHYLIHTDYRPRGRAYRAIWRHHRLHHYKNEQYWFTVTTAGTADRLLGTDPDPATVPTSPTARSVHTAA